MAATIAVVYPHMNGIGGDGFWLVREPGGRVHAIDACGPAGASRRRERYRDKGYDAIPPRGPDAALTVAGAVAGWQLALELAQSRGGHAAPRPPARRRHPARRRGLSRCRGPKPATSSRSRSSRTPPRASPRPSWSRARSRPPARCGCSRLSPTPWSSSPMRASTISTAATSAARSRPTWSAIGAPVDRAATSRPTGRARSQPLSMRLKDATLYNLPPPDPGPRVAPPPRHLRAPGRAVRRDARASSRAVEATKRAFAIRDRVVTDPRPSRPTTRRPSSRPPCSSARPPESRRGARRRFPLPDARRGRHDLDGRDRQGRARRLLHPVHLLGVRLRLRAAGDRHPLAEPGRRLLPRSRRTEPAGAGAQAVPYPQPGARRLRRRPGSLLRHAWAARGSRSSRRRSSPATPGSAWASPMPSTRRAGCSAAPGARRPRPSRWRAASTPDSCAASRERGHDVEELGDSPIRDALGHAGMLVKHRRDGRVEAAHDPRSDGGALGL